MCVCVSNKIVATTSLSIERSIFSLPQATQHVSCGFYLSHPSSSFSSPSPVLSFFSSSHDRDTSIEGHLHHQMNLNIHAPQSMRLGKSKNIFTQQTDHSLDKMSPCAHFISLDPFLFHPIQPADVTSSLVDAI